MGDVNQDFQTWMTLITLLQTEGDVKIPLEFHAQCRAVRRMLKSDTTGIINTILNFAADSASDTTYKIETGNKELDLKLNNWVANINESRRGEIPTGMRELAKEYFKERFAGSSFCILNAADWQEVNGILLPQAVWFLDGSSIYVEAPQGEHVIDLNEFEYYLDKNKQYPLLNDSLAKDKEVIIRKCFARWHEKYPVPYLILTGVLRNFLGLEVLKEKGEETLKKLLPYLLMLKKGSDSQTDKGITYDDEDMKKMNTNFKAFLQDYKTNPRSAPLYATPYDTTLEHIMPDLRNLFSKDISETSLRAIISGLGFITVIQGIGDTRKEEVINPKPFIQGVNAGVMDFKSMLNDLIEIIIEKNKDIHRKYFSDRHNFRIVNSPLKINIQFVLDAIRTSYAYGATSIETYHESLGLDHQTEKERRQAELASGDEDLFFPHVIQHQETNPKPSEDVVSPVKKSKKSGVNDKKIPMTKKEMQMSVQMNDRKIKASAICERCNQETVLEDSVESIDCGFCLATINKEGVLISDKFEIDDTLTAPYTMKTLPPEVKKLGKKLQNLWMRVFNTVYKSTKGDKKTKEQKAFSLSWYQVNRKRKNKGGTK